MKTPSPRKKVLLAMVVLLVPGLFACEEPVDGSSGDTDSDTDTDTDTGTDTDTDADADTDTDTDTDTDSDSDSDTDTGWTPPGNSLVYANTETELYRIDPSTGGALELVGALSGPCTSAEGSSGLYDIAITGDGVMVGIAAEALYTIDTETAACTLLTEFPADAPNFFSLSWVVGVDPGDPTGERLMAASAENNGEWVEVNPEGTTLDGIFIHVGYHDATTPGGEPLISSGDIVSVQVGESEWMTYATLKCSSGYTATGCESDYLASINPETGKATLIGATDGFTRLFGLGFWGDEVYGFTNSGQYVTVDVTTGLATEKETITSGFWGAGTTTEPYVVVD